MAVGDEHSYSDGRVYVETEHGPNIWWTCADCGAPAAACFDYGGVVRCSGCWPKFHGVDDKLHVRSPVKDRHLHWHSLRDPQGTVHADQDPVSDSR